jgi:hypothetical protein
MRAAAAARCYHMPMKLLVFVLLAGATVGSGCVQVPPLPPAQPTTLSSWSPMGSFTMSSGANCAGHVTLSGATATVTDSCFTSAGDVVLCTDATSAAPVQCASGDGVLTVNGAPGDTIAYARVK